jgi:site-specific DNA-methyltransferase (adenine-specific)
MPTNHRIINGDSRNMSLLQNESVHLVVTSPPYWQLKDYGSDEQIGYHESYEQYINNLNLVWNECYRVLHPGCRLCVNIGDQFARAVYYGRYKVIPIRTEIIKFCEAIGFDYMGAIIWQKVTTTNTSGGGVQMGSYPYPRNGILKIDYEFILIFKKLGDAPKPSPEQKKLSIMTNQEWNSFFAGHWNFAGVRQNNHIAMFPEELPRRLIKMFTFVGDVILDPFLGSGTTALAAKNLDRNSAGYEINKDYLPIIKEKLNCDQMDISGTKYNFLSDFSPIDFNIKIKDLPYVFVDHQKFDRKVDPKKLRFGSKIDQNSQDREEYFSVKQVISPNKVILDNDLSIRLLGVQESPTVNGQAIEYIKKKTQGQKVFIKHDSAIYDENNQMICYLYLKNRTFLNAHLIRNGLAIADRNRMYRFREKFIRLEKEAKV